MNIGSKAENDIEHNDWHRTFIVVLSFIFYIWFLPILNLIGVTNLSIFWTFAPVWFPIIGFFGFGILIGFLATITEIGYILYPDKDFRKKENKKEVKINEQ